MKKLYVAFTLLTLPFFLFAQSLNTNLLGSWDGAGEDYNDIWGYVDPSGNEYALIGSLQNIYVVNVSTPNPTLVGSVSGGGSSIWRDIKVYGNYAYAVADQSGTNEGLLVIDLSNLPNSISLAGQYNGDFGRAHNIFIDASSGRMYVAGSSGGSNSVFNGLIVYDLNSNPANPTRLVSQNLANGGYVHDVYVKNDTAYCSHGYDGLYVHDFTNTSSVTTLGGLPSYANQGYNHSGWLSSDGNSYLFADEVPIGQPLRIADVSDLSDISLFSSQVFQDCLVPNNTDCRPHNPFIHGEFAFVSYYHDGLVIFDISDPADVTLAGYYDTYPSNTSYSGFQGAWGAYPYLPSGKILISDITVGLRVVDFTNTLPVEMTRFRASKNTDGTVALHWETYAELMNDYFDIEKSADGIRWESMTKVDGRGNANGIHYYHAKDEKPHEGISYYRLRQVDFDGSSTHSKLISIETDVKTTMRAFPSLMDDATQNLTVQLPISKNEILYTAYLYGLSGKLIETYTIESDAGEAQLDVANLNKGAYVLQVVASNFNQKVRLVKH